MKFIIALLVACVCASTAFASSIYNQGGGGGLYEPLDPVADIPVSTIRRHSIVPTGYAISRPAVYAAAAPRLIPSHGSYGGNPIDAEVLWLAKQALSLRSPRPSESHRGHGAAVY